MNIQRSIQLGIAATFTALSLSGDRVVQPVTPEAYKFPEKYGRKIDQKGHNPNTIQAVADQTREDRAVVEKLLARLPIDLRHGEPEQIKRILYKFAGAELSGTHQKQFDEICTTALADTAIDIHTRFIIAHDLKKTPSSHDAITHFVKSSPLQIPLEAERSRISLCASLLGQSILDTEDIEQFIPNMHSCIASITADRTLAQKHFNLDLIGDIGLLDNATLKEVIISHLNSFDFNALEAYQKPLCNQLIGTTSGGQAILPYDESIKPYLRKAVQFQLDDRDYQLSGAYALGEELLPIIIAHVPKALQQSQTPYDYSDFVNRTAAALYSIGAKEGNEFITYLCTDKKNGKLSLNHLKPEMLEAICTVLADHQEMLNEPLQKLFEEGMKDPRVVSSVPGIAAFFNVHKGNIDPVKSWLNRSDSNLMLSALRALLLTSEGIDAVLDAVREKPKSKLGDEALRLISNRIYRGELPLARHHKETLQQIINQRDDKLKFSDITSYLGVEKADYSDSAIVDLYNERGEDGRRNPYSRAVAFNLAASKNSKVLVRQASALMGKRYDGGEFPSDAGMYLLQVGDKEHQHLVEAAMIANNKMGSPSDIRLVVPPTHYAQFSKYISPFLNSSTSAVQTSAAWMLKDVDSNSAMVVMREHVQFSRYVDGEIFLHLVEKGEAAPFQRLLRDGYLNSPDFPWIVRRLNKNYQNPSKRKQMLDSLEHLENLMPLGQREKVANYRLALREAQVYGIRLPFRLSPEHLQIVVGNNKRLLSGIPIHSSREVTGAVIAEEDWNGAFAKVGSELRGVFRHSDLYLQDVTEDEKAFKFLNLVGKQTGGITLAVVGGHGRRGMLSLRDADPRLNPVQSSRGTYDESDIKLVSRYLTPVMKKHGKCMLLSCSVGEGRSVSQKSDSNEKSSTTLDSSQKTYAFKPNLVESTAKGLDGQGITVYGAIIPLAAGDALFRYKNGSLQSIGPENLFYIVKSQIK